MYFLNLIIFLLLWNKLNSFYIKTIQIEDAIKSIECLITETGRLIIYFLFIYLFIYEELRTKNDK